MFVKKSGGKIFGANFTAAEKKALDIEVKRQLAEYDKKHVMELDAIILWQLHAQLGFGKKRLERFYRKFAEAYRDLLKRYEMEGEGESTWLFTYKVKELGVDLEALYREERNDI